MPPDSDVGSKSASLFYCATGNFDSAQARICGMCQQKEMHEVFKYSAQNVWWRSTENKKFVERKRALFTGPTLNVLQSDSYFTSSFISAFNLLPQKCKI